MPESTSYLGIYRSGLTSSEHRKHITVGRDHFVDETVETLRRNAGKAAKHHQLFIGLRGIGKTHLLSLIEDRISDDPQLRSRYLVARFPEESHRTLSFADFLLGLCEILVSAAPDEPLWQELYQRLNTTEDNQIISDTLVPALRKENQIRKRTLVIMMENLGEVFSRQMKDRREVAALRKFLMDSQNGCLLIATATQHFAGISSVDEPFYDFFDVQHLDPLSMEESISLIRRNLEWEKRDDLLADFATLEPRLMALFHMTGGNPRLTVMLSELISRESVVRVRDQFHILLDRITPFFQDRLNSLPPQERAVLETMAVMRDQEKTPASIAARMRMKTTHVSSLLKRLSDARLLRSSPHPSDKRTRLYSIAEGFFDLWLYMNLSRGARERLPFLLDFFTMFYPSILERDKKRQELITQLSDSERRPDALAALDTLSEVGTCEEKARAKLQLATVHLQTDKTEEGVSLIRESTRLPLDPMGTWIVRRAERVPAIDYLTELQQLVTLWEEHRSGDLESFARHMAELGEGLTYLSYSRAKLAFLEEHLSAIPMGSERVRLRLKIGSIYYQLARWKEATVQLQAALTEAENLSDPSLLAEAQNNLAALFLATNRLAEAEPLMRRALEIDEDSFGSNHPDVARDLHNLALLLQATNRLAEAEPLTRRAALIILQFTKNTGHPHPKLELALNNYLHLLVNLKLPHADITQKIQSLGAEAGLTDDAASEILAPFLKNKYPPELG